MGKRRSKNPQHPERVAIHFSSNVFCYENSVFSSCSEACVVYIVQLALWAEVLNTLKSCKTFVTRSTQRPQTSLAEADHYSHIAHCKNVEPWLWKTTHPPTPKKKKNFFKFWIITCTTIWVCYHYYSVVLLIYSSYNTQITTKI